jgi:hypothetical protein
MKILIETRIEIDYQFRLDNDFIDLYRINIDNMFEHWIIVLDKYQTLVQQLYYGNWLFINTIFSFLLKLKTEGDSLYYKKLHTKLLEKTKKYLFEEKIEVLIYEADPKIIEYLEIECINYTIIESMKELLTHTHQRFK